MGEGRTAAAKSIGGGGGFRSFLITHRESLMVMQKYVNFYVTFICLL